MASYNYNNHSPTDPRIRQLDIIGNAYEYLIGKFAAGADKKAGELYTPLEVGVPAEEQNSRL